MQASAVPQHGTSNVTVIRKSSAGRRIVVSLLTFLLIILVAATAFIFSRRVRYQNEIARLREGMSEVEREHTDLLLASQEKRAQVMMELVRRQASGDQNLHLAISLDSSVMHLQREGAQLRTMAIQVGADRTIGTLGGRPAVDSVVPVRRDSGTPSHLDSIHLAPPLGTRTVQQLLTARDRWTVPEMVYRDHGEEPPPAAERSIAGALGPFAVLLTGGAVIYSLPENGPLADSSYVLPAAVRVSAADMQAIFPNLRVGMRVYFY